MSAPRDVLATVRELADFAHSELSGSRGDLSGSNLLARSEQAIAAVAELIEAAGEVMRPYGMYDKAVVGAHGRMQEEVLKSGWRLRAALARVQSELPDHLPSDMGTPTIGEES